MIATYAKYRWNYLARLKTLGVDGEYEEVLNDGYMRVLIDRQHPDRRRVIIQGQRTDGSWETVQDYKAPGDGRYCNPSSCGLRSEPRAVARQLAIALNAVMSIDSQICGGEIIGDARSVQQLFRERLVADGWRVRPHRTDARWVVLPPKGRNDNADYWKQIDKEQRRTV